MSSNNSSLKPTGFPTIQFNSDTNYPELMQTPKVKGSSHFRHPLQVLSIPKLPALLPGRLQIQGVPQRPPHPLTPLV